MNTIGNTSTSIFGSRPNSTPNSFGNINSSTPSLFVVNNGNSPATNSTPSAFVVNTIGSSSTSIFANTNSSTPNPFALNTSGNTSTSIFGNTANSTSNPFGVNTAGTPSTLIFGNTNNKTPNSFDVNTVGNTSTSIFGNVANSTPNPFGVNTTGNTTSSSLLSFNGTSTGGFGTSPMTSGFTAGPTGISGSQTGFTNHKSGFGVGPLGIVSSGLTFGQPSNNIFGNRGPASPFTTSFGGSSTTFPGTSTSVPSARPFGFGTTDSGSNPFGTLQVQPSQNKGSKISPYKIMRGTERSEDRLLSISCMPIYESKSHEELRLEDSELNSRGSSSSLFPPQLPDANAAQNPFFRTQAPSTNLTPIFSQPSLPNPFSNSTSSSTTTSVFNLPPSSNPFTSLTPSLNPTPIFNQPSSPFPSLPPSFNSTPPTTISPVFNPPSPSFPINTFVPSPIPSFNSTSSTTASPVFNQPSPSFPNPTPSFNFTTSSPTTPSIFLPYSSQNPISTSIPPLTSAPSSPITWPTLAGTGNFQTNINPAPSAWVGSTLPGNNGASTGKIGDCIIAVKDPFGSQSATCPPSIAHPIYSAVSRSGISSMPVIDKPTITRISSLVTTRHISSRPLTVPVRKYQPKSDIPKVPFFDHTNETQNIQMKSTIIPRTNPRSMFVDNSKLSGLSITANDEVTDASVLHEDGEGKAKKDQASNSYNKENEKPISEKSNWINPSVPKLNRSDYYTQPSIQDLTSFETSNSGFCIHVKDFVVGRHGYGSVKFKGETDVRGLDLDTLVFFDKSEVIVYKDENEKPEIGQGLNKQAEVTLLNVKCADKSGEGYSSGKMVDKFVAKLKKVAENQGAAFVSYDAVNGVWKFQVKHFS